MDRRAPVLHGITEFVLWFNVGGIDPVHCERAMRLAMEQVIPHV